ncbi:carbohydrate kinase [Metabacillus sp. FJAT-52054]|uniref:Carbohydrate kinase n=1 Tax=Metabacillus sediminis TaxID=3117746 RepID=A0ABZ2NIR5_9BACI
MKKVYCIGETLIDFIPLQKNKALKEVGGFEKAAGGAPMNAAIAVAKYGGQSVMLTKMANDHFGDFLMDVMCANGVDVSHIVRTDEGETGLAFVSVDKDGERSFTFYRKNAADLLLEPEEVAGVQFQEGDFLHFCSVDLVESPIKQTHLNVIEAIRKANGTVCFDLNVRIPLWPDEASCRETILDFVPLADLIKVSSEELEFVTAIPDENKAIQSLLCGHVKAVVYTKGGDGAAIYLKEGQVFKDPGFKVTVEDTTGAGDAFIGGLLSELLSLEAKPDSLIQTLQTHHEQLLTFSNASGALAASVKGAIEAAPGREKVMKFIEAQRPAAGHFK